MKHFKRFNQSNTAQENNAAQAQTVLQLIDPNAIQEGDRIEAHFTCGCIERGVAVLEEKVPYHCWYRNKQRMMLCADGESRGHVITGLAGFPDGTEFYRVICTVNNAE